MFEPVKKEKEQKAKQHVRCHINLENISGSIYKYKLKFETGSKQNNRRKPRLLVKTTTVRSPVKDKGFKSMLNVEWYKSGQILDVLRVAFF